MSTIIIIFGRPVCMTFVSSLFSPVGFFLLNNEYYTFFSSFFVAIINGKFFPGRREASSINIPQKWRRWLFAEKHRGKANFSSVPLFFFSQWQIFISIDCRLLLLWLELIFIKTEKRGKRLSGWVSGKRSAMIMKKRGKEWTLENKVLEKGERYSIERNRTAVNGLWEWIAKKVKKMIKKIWEK